VTQLQQTVTTSASPCNVYILLYSNNDEKNELSIMLVSIQLLSCVRAVMVS